MELTFIGCLKGLALGLVQGLTEFLPVSSSGHLVLFKTILGYAPESGALNEALLHLGTFFAICLVFRRDVADMIKGTIDFFAALFKKDGRDSVKINQAQKMVLMILITLVPLFIIAPFKDKIEELYNMPIVVGFALIVTGAVLFIADRLPKGDKDIYSATFFDALFIGLSQAVAIIPGLSRSGTTISAGLFRRFDRRFAVRFSFLMSLPAVLGSVVLVVGDALAEGITAVVLVPALIGMVSAFVSGVAAIRLVAWLIKKDRFGGFAYYCALVGLAVVIVNMFR